MKPKAPVSRIVEIANRVAAIKDTLEAQKPLYQELDELTAELQDLSITPTLITTKDGRFVSLVDNFAEKNVVFRPTGIRRFEAKLETADEVADREAKEAAKRAKASK